MKMKFLINCFAISVLGILAACSSQAEEIKPAQENTEKTSVTLTLEAQALLPQIDSEGTRSMLFDITSDIPALKEGSNWDTHVFFRKKGDDTFVGYALIQWTVAGTTAGRIQLKQKSTTINLQNTGGKVPRAGEEWYVAGVAGGGVLNAAKTVVDFSYNAAMDDKLAQNRARIPFVFPWTKLTISSLNFSTANIQMNPQGSLVHIIATNKSGAAIDKTFKLTSNILDRNGSFDFSAASNATAKITGSGLPSWKHTNTSGTATFNIKLAGQNNANMHALVWGMARTGVATASTTIAGPNNVYRKATTTPATSAKAYASGRAYYAKVDVGTPVNGFSNGKLPLESLPVNSAGVVLAVSGNSTPYTLVDNNPQYYTWQDAWAKFKNQGDVTINGERYYLPTINQLFSIFPAGSYSYSSGNVTNANVTEAVQFFGTNSPVSVKSDYFSSNSVIYAIRFKDANGKHTNRTTAYRYQKNGPVRVHDVTVTTRYLGPSDTRTVQQLVNDATFWQSSKATSVTFRAYGYKYPSGAITNSGLQGNYWSATPLGSSAQGGVVFAGGTLDGYPGGETNALWPVILFKR